MAASQEVLVRTAEMYIDVLRKFLGDGDALPAETFISSASRMAGTFMFRTFPFHPTAEPGQVLLSEEANTKAAALTNLVDVTLRELGDKIDISKAKALFDPSKISRLSLLETQSRFEPLFRAIAKAVGLSLSEAGTAASIASAFLVHQRPQKIDINRAYAIAVYGHIEALKKVPPRLPDEAK